MLRQGAASLFLFFFFNDTATTEIYTVPYTLSLHDALPIYGHRPDLGDDDAPVGGNGRRSEEHTSELQSHGTISYAVFCLKKKKKHTQERATSSVRWRPGSMPPSMSQ